MGWMGWMAWMGWMGRMDTKSGDFLIFWGRVMSLHSCVGWLAPLISLTAD